VIVTGTLNLRAKQVLYSEHFFFFENYEWAQ
jgi:hypothetical protein